MRIGITGTYLRQDLLALVLALVIGASLVGMFVAQHPRVGAALIPVLVVGEIALLWIIKNHHARAIVGGLVFITILRPWPNVGNPFLTGRAVDLLWLFLAFIALIITTGGAQRLQRIWPGSYWLLAMTGSVLISLSVAVFFLGQPVIVRDLFELYRGPYYFLIFLVATQLTWNDRQLRDFFFKPLIIALWIAFAVSVLQGLGTELRSLVGNIYTPKSASNLASAFAAGGKIRSSGTFANPNWYGVALAMVIPFLLAGFSAASRLRLRAAIWLTSITAFIFLGITGSRTALVAGILALGIYFLWSMWDSRNSTTRLSLPHSGVSRAFTFVFVATVILLLLAFISQTARTQELITALMQGSLLDIESISVKWADSIALAQETIERSLLVGLGPSKQITQHAGDNQYSHLFFRYGILGLVIWFGFWLTIFRHALRLKRRAQTPLQSSMARAVLATVPAFVAAGVGGGFFDATQIATLYLLLIGIAFSSRGTPEEQTSEGARNPNA